jgi:hypothetical protein
MSLDKQSIVMVFEILLMYFKKTFLFYYPKQVQIFLLIVIVTHKICSDNTFLIINQLYLNLIIVHFQT